MPRGETRRLDELTIDQEIDPRLKQRSQERIERYADNIDGLPPILVDGNNRILDGIHRYYAHRSMGCDRIEVQVVEPDSQLDALTHAIKANATHGLSLSSEELKRDAIRLWESGATEEHIANTLSRSLNTVSGYLVEAKHQLIEEQRKRVVELYFDGFNQTDSAKIVSDQYPQRSINQKTVSTYLKEHRKEQVGVLHEQGLTKQEIKNKLKEAFPRNTSDPVDQWYEEYVASKLEPVPETSKIKEQDAEAESELQPAPQTNTDEGLDVDGDDEEKDEKSKRIHTEMQFKLLRLGNMFGLSVWVATDNRKNSHEGKALSELPGMLEFLPSKIRANTPQSIERIDVLWLQDENIVAAFEVEHSTDINSGLLRMSDMLVALGEATILTYIVAPNGRLDEAKRKMNRPTFEKTGQSKSCRFFPYSDLNDKFQEPEQNGFLTYNWQELLDEIGHKL